MLRYAWFLSFASVAHAAEITTSDATASSPTEAPDFAATATVETIPVATPAPPTPKLQDDAIVKLDDIIVTATRRNQALRDIPASIDFISGQKLEDAGALELRDFLRTVPGVGLTEIQPELYRISIRGIDADVSGVTSQTSGIFIDDIPFNDPFINQVRPDLPPFDLESVEVLKGPQGTLYGGSGLAGAVRYTLADAVPGAWELKAFGQYQDVEQGSPSRIGGAAVNLPLGDDAALRLVGVRRLSGGVIDDLRTGDTDTDRAASYSGRALLRWNLGERLVVRVKALTQQTEADDRPYAENADGRLEREETLGASPLRNEFDLYGLDLAYTMPWATLISTTSALRKYGESRNAGGERALGVQQLGQPIVLPTMADIDGFVQELRLVSPDDPKGGWLLGVFGHRYTAVTTQQAIAEPSLAGVSIPLPALLANVLPDPLGTLPGLGVNLANFSADVEAQELALFGEAYRRLGQRWTLTAGLRGYTVESEGTVLGSGALVLTTGSLQTRNEGRVKASGVNPKIALQFEASERVATYASIARGFRFGGIQLAGASTTSPNVPPTYDPDSIWNYELGLRTQWLQGALEADGAVYYIDWNDAQVQTSTDGALPLNVIDNVGGARSYGAELALRYRPPVTGLDLALSAAYTNTRTTAAFVAPGGDVVPSGARLPGYAEVQTTANLNYQWFWGATALAATLSHAYLSDGVSDIKQSMTILDYQSTDLRFAISNAGLPGRPKLSFGVTNLRDERAVVGAFVTDEDNFYAVYNRPRTLDARIDLSF